MEEFRVGDVIEFPGRYSKDIGVIVKVCDKTYLVELLHETMHLVETRGNMKVYDYFTYWPLTLNRSSKKTRVKKTYKINQIDPKEKHYCQYEAVMCDEAILIELLSRDM